MLSKLGSVIEMKEEHFDAFTAIVGAGPAYFALLAETLVEIAHKEGFEKPESWINTLMLGTSKIYDEEKEIGFENIMSMVASKGGVTEKALEAMKENGFKTIVSDAIKMAIERSKELGK
jgi:pyrroline-5-carboxylate reductase